MRKLLARYLPAQFSGTVMGFAGLTLLKALGGLVVLKVMASHLGPDAFGQLGQLMTVVAITSMFAGGGVTNALIQNLAGAATTAERQRRLSAAVKIYVVQASLVSLLLVAFSAPLSKFLLNRSDLAWLFCLLAATQWLVGANNLFQAIFSAMRRVQTIVAINALGIIGGAGLFLVLVMRSYFTGAAIGLVCFPAVVALVGCIAALVLLPADWRQLVRRTAREDMRSLLSYAFVMLVTVSAVPLAQLAVRDLLGDALNWNYVGYWQGVLKISDVYMQFLGMVMIYYALPRFSAQPDIARLDREFRHLQLPLFTLMLSGIVLIYLLRDVIIRLLFTADFLPARDYFLPQMAGDVMRVLSLMYVYYGVSRGARLMPIAFELLQAGALILLSYLLLPYFGPTTPVYAYMLGCCFSLLVMVGMRRRSIRRWRATHPQEAEGTQPKRRILMVCSRFSEDESNGWLTNDLAAAFDAQGHAVDVLHLDWSGRALGQSASMYGNVRVFTLPALRAPWLPGQLGHGVKWLFSSYVAARRAGRILPQREYDLIVGFSPAIVTDRLVRAYSRPNQLRYMILWDFFPRYHSELGLLPPDGALHRLAKRLEAQAIGRYRVVGCMSPGNVEYFHRYHPEYTGKVEVLPLWGPATLVPRDARAAMRAELGLTDEVACVFGGQLIPGRGIEHIFTLAARVKDSLPNVRFIIAGAGPLEPMIQERIASGETPNVRFVGLLTRARYLDLLAAGDIGLVFNSGHVSVPTYPSKTIDYFRAGLPILGAVEVASDYSAIIEAMGAGFSTSPDAMARIEEKLRALADSADLRRRAGERGQEYFLREMTADHIVRRIERHPT